MLAQQEFDFVIVGAGSAGCVLAEKLSANGKHSVLVLEAGGSDRRFFIQMPLGYGKTFYDPSVNWMYRAEPDPGLDGNADFWPRGKVVGGSSSINALVYVRGQREDFDRWRDAGNPGWGYDDVLPFFKAMEDNDFGADAYHGAGGPLHVTDTRSRVHPLCEAFFRASEQAGLKRNPDFNGAIQEGVGHFQINTKNGRRCSAADAFLRPALRRGNVALTTEALATRVCFDGRQATGVEYVKGGRTHEVKARREVILCGGSVNTPQLLQLSGIGPAALLKEHGVEVILDSRHVGQNLADHQGINYTFETNVPTMNQMLRPWWGKVWAGLQYLALKSGPLSISMNHAGGFFRTSAKHKTPNMQLYFQAFSTLKPKPGERPILTPDPFAGFSIGLSNCRPTSRGSISIKSADPWIHPEIKANVFSTANDVEEMLEAVKYIRTLASQPAMREIIKTEIAPGPSIQSDEDVILDFRRRSGTVYHPVSTCRMGSDPLSSVVDSRLHVHGVSGLRIADCSVFPDIISGNTNAAAMMIGAKAADLILADRGV
jgi:choline dehydrogenase